MILRARFCGFAMVLALSGCELESQQSVDVELLDGTDQELEQRGDEELVIPVVFHIYPTTLNPAFHLDLATLERLVADLNRAFEGTNECATLPAKFAAVRGKSKIRFKLDITDPEGYKRRAVIYHRDKAPSPELIESQLWPVKNYINIVFAENLILDGKVENETIDAEVKKVKGGDYIYIDSENFTFLKTTKYGFWQKWTASTRWQIFVSFVAHELGHFFGLVHPWKFDDDAKNNDCKSDDGFNDTPQQKYPTTKDDGLGVYNVQTFPWTLNVCKKDVALGTMYTNFMDFTYLGCMFTTMQAGFMEGWVKNQFQSLLNSPAFIPGECQRDVVDASKSNNSSQESFDLGFISENRTSALTLCQADEDWFEFRVTPEAPNLEIRTLDNGFVDTDLELYDAPPWANKNLAPIIKSVNVGNNWEHIPTTKLDPQKSYYLRIFSKNQQFDNEVPYYLWFNVTP